MNHTSAFAPWLYRALSAALGRKELECPPLAGANELVIDQSFLATLGAIAGIKPQLIDSKLAEKGRIEMIRTAAINMMFLNRMKPVAEALETERIPWAVLKGLDSLARFYPDLHWRRLTDVDILVSPKDVSSAQKILREAGFTAMVPETSSAQHALAYAGDWISIDLHRTLLRSRNLCDADVFLRSSSVAMLAECPVRTMDPLHALGAMILLLGKDSFSPLSIHPVRLVEIAFYLEMVEEPQLSDLAETMKKLHASRIFTRAIETVQWMQGGTRPGWMRENMGEPGVYLGTVGRKELYQSQWALRDNTWDALCYLKDEFSISLLRAVSGRRWGRWES